LKKDYFLILAGGVGAAKFIDGLQNIVNQESLKVIVNTGDDLELFGLKICPDLDIITYTLAGVVNKEKGWGFKDETFNSLEILKRYYALDWFNAGDKDLATHIYRTDLLRKGFSKSEATKKICEKLGVRAEVIPMCNENVETYIEIPSAKIHFEEYYIKYGCKPKILNVEFRGIKKAKPTHGVIELIKKASKVIICPSNPVVSIGTILQVKGIKTALKNEREKVYAISPIVKGATIKGPADKLLENQGFDVSCLGVAEYYKEILGTFIIDNKDMESKPKIEGLGIKTYCFDTLMINLNKKKELAQFIINLK